MRTDWDNETRLGLRILAAINGVDKRGRSTSYGILELCFGFIIKTCFSTRSNERGVTRSGKLALSYKKWEVGTKANNWSDAGLVGGGFSKYRKVGQTNRQEIGG